MFIFSTRSINILGVNPFVKRSAIIKFVLICFIDTLCFWISSFTTKYFNIICLTLLEYLSFLEKNIVAKLSQYIFTGIVILLTISSLGIKFCSQLAWIVASKHAINSVFKVDTITIDAYKIIFICFRFITYLGHCARLNLPSF